MINQNETEVGILTQTKDFTVSLWFSAKIKSMVDGLTVEKKKLRH